jgi:hypothetical protein
MSRSRCALHKTKLADFRAFCEGRGWTAEQTKNGFEVLRMRHPGRADPLIVHTRLDAAEHYTTWGESQTELRAWMKARKS